MINEQQERKSVLYVPLKIKDKILGILGVDRYRTRMEITQDDVESLTIFANQASIIIEDTRLYQALCDEKALSENIIKCSTNGVVVTDLMGRVPERESPGGGDPGHPEGEGHNAQDPGHLRVHEE